ncbi:MAG: NAD(P)H-hydrate repair Nnr-like enzyme with NAD(P)H-hydrate dehydratase domain, partial [Lysobacterales bacterium]
MQLPTLLSRNKKLVHKNSFGHLLVLAGSQRMLGAAGLVGLSAMRTGAGLVTLGVVKSLNTALQKKINNCLMTWPLPETKTQSISSLAYKTIENKLSTYACIAIGPGLSTDKSTVTFIYKIIRNS